MSEKAPWQPLLPIVSEETVEALTASSEETGNVTEITFNRMLQGQPALAAKISAVIMREARDDTEKFNMVSAAVIVYKMLELQAEANQFDAQVNGATSDPPVV